MCEERSICPDQEMRVGCCFGGCMIVSVYDDRYARCAPEKNTNSHKQASHVSPIRLRNYIYFMEFDRRSGAFAKVITNEHKQKINIYLPNKIDPICKIMVFWWSHTQTHTLVRWQFINRTL